MLNEVLGANGTTIEKYKFLGGRHSKFYTRILVIKWLERTGKIDFNEAFSLRVKACYKEYERETNLR